MATIRVTSNGALTTALRTAASGDTIQLSGGNFSLDVKSSTKSLTITSDGSATVTHMEIVKSSNLTIDRLAFNAPDSETQAFIVRSSSNVTIRDSDMEGVASGYGVGRGLWAGDNTDFTFQNNKMHGFSTGLFLVNSDDIVIRDNTLSNIKWDGMIVGQIDGGRFLGNTIDLNSTPGLKHSDGMQFWNTGKNNPSSDLVIEDNVIRTHNAQSHGIYMANAVANQGGGSASHFQNVQIQDNIVVNADGFGIAWGQTAGLAIKDNIILRDIDALPASVRGNVPHILVHKDSSGVTISGNTTHMVPWSTDAQWQPNGSLSGWTVANNTIVPVGTRLGDVSNSPQPSPSSPPPPPPAAEHYRFDNSGPTDVVSNLNFGRGDTIEFYNYKGGTFHGQKGGNELIVTVKGAMIDSIADLKELDAASTAVTIHAIANDTLAIDIVQPAGIHSVHLLDFAHLY